MRVSKSNRMTDSPGDGSSPTAEGSASHGGAALQERLELVEGDDVVPFGVDQGEEGVDVRLGHIHAIANVQIFDGQAKIMESNAAVTVLAVQPVEDLGHSRGQGQQLRPQLLSLRVPTALAMVAALGLGAAVLAVPLPLLDGRARLVGRCRSW